MKEKPQGKTPSAIGGSVQRSVMRLDVFFPLRPMTLPGVKVTVDAVRQTITFTLPGGQVFRTALWIVLEQSGDQYGRGFQEVLEKSYHDKAA